jgi:cell division protein FtsB
MPLLDRRAAVRHAALVLALLGLSLADPDGLRKALRNEAEVRRLERENAALEQRVGQLRREVKALQGDPAAVEHAAREELGYVKPGEIVYKLDEVASP